MQIAAEYQKFSSADEKNGERLNCVWAYGLWWGEAPARPRQLLMAMM
jgi:hypothetical protein